MTPPDQVTSQARKLSPKEKSPKNREKPEKSKTAKSPKSKKARLEKSEFENGDSSRRNHNGSIDTVPKEPKMRVRPSSIPLMATKETVSMSEVENKRDNDLTNGSKPDIEEQLNQTEAEANAVSKKSEIQLENSICENSMKISPRLSEIDHTKTSESLDDDCTETKNEIFQTNNNICNQINNISPEAPKVSMTQE